MNRYLFILLFFSSLVQAKITPYEPTGKWETQNYISYMTYMSYSSYIRDVIYCFHNSYRDVTAYHKMLYAIKLRKSDSEYTLRDGIQDLDVIHWFLRKESNGKLDTCFQMVKGQLGILKVSITLEADPPCYTNYPSTNSAGKAVVYLIVPVAQRSKAASS